MSNVLVTGGAGFIGSHMTYALLDRGDEVTVLDNLATGVRSLVAQQADFIEGDVADAGLVRDILRGRKIDAVIHFAGSVVVPESVADPLKYYGNNTAATRDLLEACIAERIGRFVFSSTAAVYGMPDETIVTEETPTAPINPYGRSKLMTEWMLRDIAKAHPFRFVALRYFNVAGADPAGRTGQSTPRATHLIKRACQAALGRAPALDIFGTDFSTPDGTGVRDYIHISDLIAAHLKALDALANGAESDVYNCGYGRGLSVREIVQAVERVAGIKVPTREGPRRPGDPAMLVADSGKLKRTLGWTPQHGDIDEIVKSAFEWERRLA
ncbi:UDP-glucose 4-epimerase GalE [Rhizomicrobium electricum]|uniref:UDP-glucose 4-epimerase n=1 Tax=Rhizomicrobium electricum TaxID=480070 RepID=A0ABP3PKP3_9PROT|nr:UDP-glucose 4-epimerase GalE [Rhizomicrobium electricum]NIJ46991.1 UDP-glucose 4-epimerase [Rhizomicrobium electricum]